jgi:hypothetical protein
MKLRFALPGALVALVAAAALSLTAATATAAPAQQSLSVPVTAAQSGGALSGVVTITNIVLNSAGQVVANGTFTGQYTDPVTGAVTQLTNATLSGILNGASAAGGCQILDLTLGPLDLNVLGLVVHLDTVHLNITAQPGPGNLLGNLLCSVANLLNNSGSGGGLQGLVNLLNQLLGGL